MELFDNVVHNIDGENYHIAFHDIFRKYVYKQSIIIIRKLSITLQTDTPCYKDHFDVVRFPSSDFRSEVIVGDP